MLIELLLIDEVVYIVNIRLSIYIVITNNYIMHFTIKIKMTYCQVH